MDGKTDSIYQQAFDSISIPALITDENFLIRDVNAAGLSFTGYEREEFVGEQVSIVAGDEGTFSEIANTVANDEVWQGEFELKTKQGKIVYGQGSAAPLFEDGSKQGYVAIFVDTTKRRRYQSTSEVLNRLLRHDLRNDMNALYGSLQRALESVDDSNDVANENLSDARDKLAEILGKAERARDLSELLGESYDAENRPIRLDYALHEVIVDAVQEFEDAEFRFEELPNVTVSADDLVTNVFEILLENAVVHNDEENPVVEVDVNDRDSEVVVSVADNGPGVRDADKDRIFGREERGPLHHGSGISLFFADNVMESYEGEIWVEDNDPKGAVFKCRFERV